MTAPLSSPTSSFKPRFNPQKRHRNFVLAMWVLGLVTLGALVLVLNAPYSWIIKLMVWVVLTYIADEAGNWFGYLAIPLGAIPFFLTTMPEQWYVVFPLIASALTASLLLKHAGGLLVLPFAAAAFAAPIILATKLTPHLDPSITLLGNHTFEQRAFLAMGIGLGISLLRQVIELSKNASRRRPSVVVTTTSLVIGDKKVQKVEKVKSK